MKIEEVVDQKIIIDISDKQPAKAEAKGEAHTIAHPDKKELEKIKRIEPKVEKVEKVEKPHRKLGSGLPSNAHPIVQLAVTSTATSLQSLCGDVSPYPNKGGFQIKCLSSASNSIFYGLASNVTISSASDEIPAGTAQVISPAMAADSSQVYLVATTNTVATVVFLGG